MTHQNVEKVLGIADKVDLQVTEVANGLMTVVSHSISEDNRARLQSNEELVLRQNQGRIEIVQRTRPPKA